MRKNERLIITAYCPNIRPKAQTNLARANEIENKVKELDRQIAEFCEMSELMGNAAGSGVTGELVDRLIDSIKVYSDRNIEIRFRFESGYELIEGVAV